MSLLNMATSPDYSQLLRSKGLRATPARISLLSLLDTENKPMSAKDIEDHATLLQMDQATLYRNLQSLRSAGLIRQLDLQERFSFYETTSKGDHHHIVCVQCGKIEEIEDCPALELIESLGQQSSKFTTILHHSLEFYGICRDCSNE